MTTATDPSNPTPDDSTPVRAALVVAHAAHTFKLYGWMLAHKPTLHILTNSADTGPLGPSHVASLLADLEHKGIRRGEVFDEVSDADVFRAILAGDTGLYTAMVDRLAASFVRERIELVVGDAHEGCQPAHDLGRAATDAAIAIAERKLGHPIANYACRQTEWLAPPPPHDATCRHLTLDGPAFARKLAAAQAYPEWRAVVGEAIEQLGLDHFRTECLRSVRDSAPPVYAAKTHYEIDGERQVALGRFQTVIRYEQHIRPIWLALREYGAAQNA